MTLEVGLKVKTYDQYLYCLKDNKYRGGIVKGVVVSVSQTGFVVAWDAAGDWESETCTHHIHEWRDKIVKPVEPVNKQPNQEQLDILSTTFLLYKFSFDEEIGKFIADPVDKGLIPLQRRSLSNLASSVFDAMADYYERKGYNQAYDEMKGFIDTKIKNYLRTKN